uniref:THAP-type domain-containing protein n=1 Tax=Ciona savignyi TaxID=51511 RepID=H2ZPD8_CIOSA
MTKNCCFAQCQNNNSSSSLFKIPSKKYYSGQKREWADDLEKVILSYRQDDYIYKLYKKDEVRICECHFVPSDIIKKGSRKELKIGSIPTLHLPQKLYMKRRSAQKAITPKLFALCLKDIEKQLKLHT